MVVHDVGLGERQLQDPKQPVELALFEELLCSRNEIDGLKGTHGFGANSEVLVEVEVHHKVDGGVEGEVKLLVAVERHRGQHIFANLFNSLGYWAVDVVVSDDVQGNKFVGDEEEVVEVTIVGVLD